MPSRRSPADPAFTLTTPGPIHRIRVLLRRRSAKYALDCNDWRALGRLGVGGRRPSEPKGSALRSVIWSHRAGGCGRRFRTRPSAFIFPFTIGDIYQN
ncbi:hypothetical protein HMPREF9440_00871 [Sutterella parvirubra YIT 11816]|uniref:Uncharacterized protein n=1 Tax=Sutterella parvirubra YIT 11816 TaxID=762967 RepID=H3KDR0_9BURK|nr:hypothetical protein HMPREF9440_00871 [Sutterella parvirubra YIT 11816]